MRSMFLYLRSLLTALAPISLFAILLWFGVGVPIQKSENSLKDQIAQDRTELTKLEERLKFLDLNSSASDHAPEIWWKKAKNVTNPSLAIQSALDGIAKENGLVLDLIGPAGVVNGEIFHQFFVELEGEANYEHLLRAINDIDAQTMPIGIQYLSIRPSRSARQKVPGTRIYFRMVAWGFGKP